MGWWTDGLQGRVLLLEQGNKADTEGSHSQGKERWGFKGNKEGDHSQGVVAEML